MKTDLFPNGLHAGMATADWGGGCKLKRMKRGELKKIDEAMKRLGCTYPKNGWRNFKIKH